MSMQAPFHKFCKCCVYRVYWTLSFSLFAFRTNIGGTAYWIMRSHYNLLLVLAPYLLPVLLSAIFMQICLGSGDSWRSLGMNLASWLRVLPCFGGVSLLQRQCMSKHSRRQRMIRRFGITRMKPATELFRLFIWLVILASSVSSLWGTSAFWCLDGWRPPLSSLDFSFGSLF